jgi:hypothetical protein
LNVPRCTEEEFQESLLLTQKYAPREAPAGWKELPPFPGQTPQHGIRSFQRIGDKLAVLVSASRWPGDVVDRVWLHVSLSRPGKMPSYQDMCDVKAAFVGRERKALQVFAEESQHVNIHPYCLHLWCVVEGDDGMPDFGAAGTI